MYFQAENRAFKPLICQCFYCYSWPEVSIPQHSQHEDEGKYRLPEALDMLLCGILITPTTFPFTRMS
jgi:hypothetical protein